MVDADQKIVCLGNALHLREAGLPQAVLKDGGADRAFIDDDDFERGIALPALRLGAGAC
jgi:hypothetical protein